MYKREAEADTILPPKNTWREREKPAGEENKGKPPPSTATSSAKKEQYLKPPRYERKDRWWEIEPFDQNSGFIRSDITAK